MVSCVQPLRCRRARWKEETELGPLATFPLTLLREAEERSCEDGGPEQTPHHRAVASRAALVLHTWSESWRAGTRGLNPREPRLK